MNKLYDRIDFVNNTTPALNETNLDLMSKAIDDIDDRVIEIAGDVLVVVPEILDKYADIEALATNPPYVGQNGHWWTWDTDTNQYVDSGVDAGVSVTVGTTTTLPAGSSATVTNSGTDTDPILNFGIPQGAAGQNGQDGQDGTDGQDGVSPEVTITTITDGHMVTITDADHPTGQSFNVMDGQDGAPGVGVPSGGTTGQVLKKVSGTDYDTEWANESGGGSGGHTIINSSGTSMTQRDGLQFSSLNVTDDSVNDKTVVTLPTPDYVDAQYSSSTTYSKGMTCIEGNVRYRYKNSTATSGHRPPDTTYWEVLSVSDEIAEIQKYEKSYCGIICDKVIYGRVSQAISGSSDTVVTVDLTPFGFSVAPEIVFADNKNIAELYAAALTATSITFNFRAITAGTYTINYVLLENPQNYISVGSGNSSLNPGQSTTMTFDLSSYNLSDVPSDILVRTKYGASNWYVSSKSRTSISVSYTAQWLSNYHNMRLIIPLR